MPTEQVTVLIGGRRFPLWEEVDVSYSAHAAVRQARLTSADPRTVGAVLADIELGAPASVSAGGQVLVTGFVTELDPQDSAAAHKLTLTIGSKSQHAVETSADHPTGELRGKRLSRALAELDPSGTEWVPGDDSIEALIRIRPGESPFDIADRVARRQGVLVISRADGGVDFVKGVRGHHAGGIIGLGGPLGYIEGRGHLSLKGQAGRLRVHGQSHERSDIDALKVVHEVTTGLDLPRLRLLTLEGEATPDNVRERAEFAAQRVRGDGTRANLTLPRWRDSGGQLWTPAFDVQVTAPRLRIDQVMAITGVSLHQSNGRGTVATLELVDPRGIAGKRGRGGKSGPEWGGEAPWAQG